MNTVLWVLQWLLAAAFLMAALGKLTQPHEKLTADPRMAWTNDFSANAVKLIGVAEVLAAVGLVAPGLADTATVLTPLAAVGLVILMAGAAATHRRRGENQVVPINGLLLLIAAFVAFGRFVLEPLA